MGIRQATTRTKGEVVNWIGFMERNFLSVGWLKLLVKFQSRFGLS